MIDGLVVITQIGLAALVLLMAFRVNMLVRSAPLTETGFGPRDMATPVNRKDAPVARAMAAPDRTELLTQLHILAGLQDRDCRGNGLDLTQAPEAVRSYAAAWLYGAACALCNQSARHSDSLAGLVAHIASRKTGSRQSQALQTISTLTQSGVLLACYRGGLEGAEFWRQHHYVSPNHSLYEAITANAFI